MASSREFRSEASYNNIMYALAGKIAEKLSNQPFEKLMKDRLLHQLGMTSTTFRHEGTVERIVRASQYGYIYTGSPPVNISADKYRYKNTRCSKNYITYTYVHIMILCQIIFMERAVQSIWYHGLSPILNPPLLHWHWTNKYFQLQYCFDRGASSVAPALALCSTAVDMAKWLLANLENSAEVLNNTLVSEVCAYFTLLPSLLTSW